MLMFVEGGVEPVPAALGEHWTAALGDTYTERPFTLAFSPYRAIRINSP